jgi:hypothetical protein
MERQDALEAAQMNGGTSRRQELGITGILACLWVVSIVLYCPLVVDHSWRSVN